AGGLGPGRAGGLPVPAHADPGGGLRGPAEGGPGRAARGRGHVAGAGGDRPDPRVRGHRGLPPGAGLPVTLGAGVGGPAGVAGEGGLWRAAVERAHLRLFIDAESGTEEAKRVAEGAIPVFEREGDDLGLAKAWRLLAEVDWIPCRAAGAERALERAIDYARRA